MSLPRGRMLFVDKGNGGNDARIGELGVDSDDIPSFPSSQLPIPDQHPCCGLEENGHGRTGDGDEGDVGRAERRGPARREGAGTGGGRLDARCWCAEGCGAVGLRGDGLDGGTRERDGLGESQVAGAGCGAEWILGADCREGQQQSGDYRRELHGNGEATVKCCFDRTIVSLLQVRATFPDPFLSLP